MDQSLSRNAHSVGCLSFLSFAVCWLPWAVLLLGKSFTHSVNVVPFAIVQGLVYLTSIVNPYLYGLGNRGFRVAVIKTFRPTVTRMPCFKKRSGPTQTLDINFA